MLVSWHASTEPLLSPSPASAEDGWFLKQTPVCTPAQHAVTLCSQATMLTAVPITHLCGACCRRSAELTRPYSSQPLGLSGYPPTFLPEAPPGFHPIPGPPLAASPGLAPPEGSLPPAASLDGFVAEADLADNGGLHKSSPRRIL